MSRWPVVALWVTIAHFGVVLAITLSRCHFRYSLSWDLEEFWILVGLVASGYAVLVAVAIWITRTAKGPAA
jgi:hypothetical protein